MSENDDALDIEDAVSLLPDPIEDNPEDEEQDEQGTTEDDAEEPDSEGAESDPEEEGDEEEPEAQEEDLVEVFLDGEWVALPRDEAKAAALRHADYTHKTMAVSEERKAVEKAKSDAEEQRAQLLDALAQWAVPEDAEPDWMQLAQTMDPQAFQLERIKWEQRRDRSEQAKQYYQELKVQEQQETAAREKSLLLKEFPEWSDPMAFQEGVKPLVKAGLDAGFSQDELNAIQDHRYFKILHKAALYDKAQEGVEKKVSKVKQSIKPGAKTTKKQAAANRQSEARSRFMKSGSIEDAMKLDF